MKIRLAAIVLALFGVVTVVQADIPGPGPRPKPPVPAPPVVADKSVPLLYEMADGNGPAKLIIPKKFAGQMKAAIDMHSTDAVAENSPSRMPAILAGLFLTLSLAFSGLWLVRSRGLVSGRTGAMILAGAALLALGSALVWANGAAPGVFARPAVQPANGDRVIIEIVEQGDAVKMILPRNRIAGLVIPAPQPPAVQPPNSIPAPTGRPKFVPPAPAPAPQPAPANPANGGLNGAFAPGNPGVAVPVKPVVAQD